MQTNVGSSIQEYCKKINSAISKYDIYGLTFVVAVLLVLYVYILTHEVNKKKEVTFSHLEASSSLENTTRNAPFGSKNGKTFTYAWCKGSTRIKEANKVYFGSKEQAEKSGRSLSKLCGN